jgi:hypothetical protein
MILLGVLLLILIVLLSINLKVWKYVSKKEIRSFTIIDQCSILFNNVLHTIKDESSCENRCRSDCLAREMKFYNSEFSLNGESCNNCNCYCK